MNQIAIDALVNASLRGVRQIKYQRSDGNGGRCALGVVCEAITGNPSHNDYRAAGLYWNPKARLPCLAGDCTELLNGTIHMMTHLNNDHEWDFLTIARKMESLSEPAA